MEVKAILFLIKNDLKIIWGCSTQVIWKPTFISIKIYRKFDKKIISQREKKSFSISD
jgi:hypothetical protein